MGGYLETEKICDYLSDGAKAVGNATVEEFQFVTSCLANDGGDQELVTEAVIREGSTTGQNSRPLTRRELEEEKAKREKAGNMALHMAENMIKFKETNKDGQKKATKIETKTNPSTTTAGATTTKEEEKDEILDEIYASMPKEEIDAIVKECEQNKSRGNEAFGSGEYAQAILLYTLALDKADELPDTDNEVVNIIAQQQLVPRDVILSNRAACFLKLGQHEKASADAKQAHEMNPKNV